MNLSAVDLNLLVVLHAVLEERSATRAARRLHVTQSAVSNALVRLRDLFQDPLVVRDARGLAPTPRAEALRPELEEAMRRIGALLDGGRSFDPASTTREFTIACADYYSVVVLPPLLRRLRERAPGATLRFVTLEQLVATGGLARDVDLHIGMPPAIPVGCTAAPFFEDSYVCLTARGEAPRAERMSRKAYLAAAHVRARVLDRERDAVDDALARRGLARRVALTVPHFSVVPMAVLHGGYVATLSRRLAETYAAILPLDIVAPPLPLPRLSIRAIWHERTDADPGARFLRRLVREAAEELKAG